MGQKVERKVEYASAQHGLEEGFEFSCTVGALTLAKL